MKKNWSVVVLFLNTWDLFYAIFVDEKCYTSLPCHRHQLICNGGNINRKIAITDAKFGFKTSVCEVSGCDFRCCTQESGDCFEPFSKDITVQRHLYEQCEFQEQCILDEPHRITGCRGGQSTYSRIEYECFEESSILRRTGSLRLKQLSVLFRGSDREFPATGITCSIRTTGLLRVTNYYTKLTRDGSEDANTRSKPDFFDDANCTTGHKAFVQTNEGVMFWCHKEGEFFYSETREIEGPTNLKLVIYRLDETDVMWLGFFAPQSGGIVDISCEELRGVGGILAPMPTTSTTIATTDPELATDDAEIHDNGAIWTWLAVVLSIIGIIVVVLVYIFRRRSKSKKGRIRKYSAVEDGRQLDESHYTDEQTENKNNEIRHQNNESKFKNSESEYTYVDQDTRATTSSEFQPTSQVDSGAYTYVDQEYLHHKVQDPSKVTIVELQTPDSPKYSHIVDQKPGTVVANEVQGPQNLDKGDQSSLQTDDNTVEDTYNHISALTSKSRQ